MATDYFATVVTHFPPGERISNGGAGYRIVGMGRSYGEEAIRYQLAGGSTKLIPRSHINAAFKEIAEKRAFTREKFQSFEGAGSNPCNFAVLGAFLAKVAGARKVGRGRYET